MKAKSFFLKDCEIKPGQRTVVDIPAGQLYTHTPLNVPVHVINGKKAGPCLLICAAIHGDEINGVEIIRRLMQHSSLSRLHGTLIAAPIVNVFGFIHRSRYLPDRRDLNRCFPGSDKGSLAARIAHIVRVELVEQASHIIDLHTGAVHRANLPQIRANMDNLEIAAMAEQFSAPVIINNTGTEGSLRGWCESQHKKVMTYEAGEALRFDEHSIKAGVKGILKVMRSLGMLPSAKPSKKAKIQPTVARNSYWLRAEVDGIFSPTVKLGQLVERNKPVGYIRSPFGESEFELQSRVKGIVIGKTNLPLVNAGEALIHIASFDDTDEIVETVKAFHSEFSDEIL